MMQVVPDWVAEEQRRRIEKANDAYNYMTMVTSLGGFMSREEYVAKYLETFEPITWTSASTHC